jgi:hypothetical protein
MVAAQSPAGKGAAEQSRAAAPKNILLSLSSLSQAGPVISQLFAISSSTSLSLILIIMSS